MFTWVVKDDVAVSLVSPANKRCTKMSRNADGLKIPTVHPSDAVELSSVAVLPEHRGYKLYRESLEHSDQADMTDIGAIETWSRQSKRGFVRAVTNRYRTPYSDIQKGILETAYIQNWGFITIEKKRYLARQLGLTERQIKVWFQNRRARDRRENKRKVQERGLLRKGSPGSLGDKQAEGEMNGDNEDCFEDQEIDMDEGDSDEDEEINERSDSTLSTEMPRDYTYSSPYTYDKPSPISVNRSPSNQIPSPNQVSPRESATPPPLRPLMIDITPYDIVNRSSKSSRKDYEPRKHQNEGLVENIDAPTREVVAVDP
ncbi:caudal-like homeodomain transcription factor [Saccoglossus kowalevskii]|uniref:Caudal-like homeodomain transcription factor n=1 Tax=Saccoglossus kowalevskii TaxID=10224 RepID=D2XMR2_SACKO|nr:caudal-like homeodomain transcription factor [Saccoglossus kowalevskii]ADB22399.1 caudal-like homeodomain transcription factor [Saccoglossus kowalevskii]